MICLDNKQYQLQSTPFLWNNLFCSVKISLCFAEFNNTCHQDLLLCSIGNLHVIIRSAPIRAVSCPWGPKELIGWKPADSCLNKLSLGVKCRRPAGREGCWMENKGRGENDGKLNHQEMSVLSQLLSCFFYFLCLSFFVCKMELVNVSFLRIRFTRNE